MFLLSHLGVHTSVLTAGIFMAVTGFGLGLTMQVLVLAVQNTVAPNQLGVATSAATFFRSIGGVVGVSIFSAIFNHELAHNVRRLLPQLGGESERRRRSCGPVRSRLPSCLRRSTTPICMPSPTHCT